MAAASRPAWPVVADWVAGLSIAGLLLPEAVAYAGIAGAPPQAGVIALFAGLLVYGLLGSSRFARGPRREEEEDELEEVAGPV